MRTSSVLAYGALGFPLAFAALPLYVHVPRLYAESLGLSLGVVGVVLLAARLADAVIDPWLGRWSDRSGGGAGRRRQILWALPLLALGLPLLLAPPSGAGLGWLVAALMLTFFGFSVITINYHAWGAEVGNNDHDRAQVTAAREAFALAGVVIAAALPMLLAGLPDEAGGEAPAFAAGMRQTAWVFLPVLAVAALVTLAGSPRATSAPTSAGAVKLLDALRDPMFARLLVVLVVGGIASAIPATLVLFFIGDVLQMAQWQGAFLALYFLAGAATLPLWVLVARRRGKVFAWAASMALAIASFVWAFSLGPGDGLAFAAICAASGAALGAELAVPPALLADRLARRHDGRDGPVPAGSYFGVWNFFTKLNLALAAGIALPLVGYAGYQAGTGGTGPVAGLAALSAVYALLPAAIKFLALILLWHWRKILEPVSNEAST